MSFEIVSSETMFTGRIFDVRRDHVRLPDGKVAKFEFVVHEKSITLLPIDQDGQIWFIEQFRHPVGKNLLELPAGVMGKGEEPIVAAQRELREETGVAARELTCIGEFYLAPGYSDEYMYVYLARQLYPAPLTPDEDEFIRVIKTPAVEALRMGENGQIFDAKTLAALLLARPYLGI